MKILQYIFSGKHNNFANSLADNFMETCPLEVINDLDNQKNKNKYTKTINRTLSEAREYANKDKLNLYTKAKIGNKFMWRLKEAGYDKVFVDNITADILKSLG